MTETRARTVRIAVLAAMTLMVSAGAGARPGKPQNDPFAFLGPSIAVNAADRHRLENGEVVVRVLPGRDGELGVFVATRLDAPDEALVVWTRAIEELKKSRYLIAIRRFSDPPVLEDLKDLVLDEGDVEAIRRCRIGKCGIKLAALEIEWLRDAIATDTSSNDTVQHAFRRLVLQRVEAYRAANPSDWETFFYWSKEHYGAGKRLITATHVTIQRASEPNEPSVLVLGREIFATHYRNASVGTTAVARDGASGIGYLVYVNRSHVDMMSGLFGGLTRMLIEGRLKNGSADLVRTVKSRIESGEPSPDGHDTEGGELW